MIPTAHSPRNLCQLYVLLRRDGAAGARPMGESLLFGAIRGGLS